MKGKVQKWSFLIGSFHFFSPNLTNMVRFGEKGLPLITPILRIQWGCKGTHAIVKAKAKADNRWNPYEGMLPTITYLENFSSIWL